MRNLDWTNQYERDVKRKEKGYHRKKLAEGAELDKVLEALANDIKLPTKNVDHLTQGKFQGYADCRDCHIAPDLILLYKKIGKDTLQLIRLGSHAELFSKKK